MGGFPLPALLDSSRYLLSVGPLEDVPSSTGGQLVVERDFLAKAFGR
jgi:hypothetical protein